ncbi:MAG: diacylglycerol kinase family protein [Saprospiraceae bacterium]|nr:diacylglycerol kinase family protein [Saprospiraceae bacterium]
MHPRIKSFKYAINGLKVMFAEEPHARFHVIAAIAVVTAGFYFDISHGEWLAIILCIGGVLAAEALNTAVENLGNAISQDHNLSIGNAKDVSAAGVLIISFSSAIIGGIIFIPRILELFDV